MNTPSAVKSHKQSAYCMLNAMDVSKRLNILKHLVALGSLAQHLRIPSCNAAVVLATKDEACEPPLEGWHSLRLDTRLDYPEQMQARVDSCSYRELREEFVRLAGESVDASGAKAALGLATDVLLKACPVYEFEAPLVSLFLAWHPLFFICQKCILLCFHRQGK